MTGFHRIDGSARMLAALIAVVLFGGACAIGDCQNGSWGPRHGWKCHDDNDERGPQRDLPQRKDFAERDAAARR